MSQVANAEPHTLTIWPLWQRLLHWSLALSIIGALVTHESGRLHEWIGYLALALASLRVLLGLIGPKVARFSTFLRSPAETLAYARAVLVRREARHLNHNPLGAWMVVTLLGLSILGAGFGWLYTTDRFWGVEWVITAHALSTWPFVGLIAMHLLGVVHAALRHRENLVGAMIHGKKRCEAKN